MRIPFKVGYCVNCGAQTFVRSPQGAPIKPLLGAQLVWLCLCKEDGSIGTRVGSVSLCKDCEIDKVDCADVEANLIAGENSGFNGDEIELSYFPKRKLELIKRFGD